MARNVIRINGPVGRTARCIDEGYCEQVCIRCSPPTPECICRTGIDYGGKIERFRSLVQCKLQKFIITHRKIFNSNSRHSSYNMLVHSDISECPWHY
jgi:hypothetical protein